MSEVEVLYQLSNQFLNALDAFATAVLTVVLGFLLVIVCTVVAIHMTKGE